MKFKTTTVILAFLFVAVWLVSCTDVPSSGPTPPTFNAEYRFFNAAEDLGSVSVTVDGQAAGTINFNEATSHGTYPAGSRSVTAGGESFTLSMATDQRGTFVFQPLISGDASRSVTNLLERRIFNPASQSTARYRIFNVVTDTTQTLGATFDTTVVSEDSITIDTTTFIEKVDTVGLDISVAIVGDTTVNENVAYGSASNYANIPAGSYSVTVTTGSDTLGTSSVTLTNVRQTTMVTGDVVRGTVAIMPLTDN